jgi:hypothetical protein
MKFYNLTDRAIEYRRKPIAPNGGFQTYPDLVFIPDRDRELERRGVLSFGSLPKYWRPVSVSIVRPRKTEKALPVPTPKVEEPAKPVAEPWSPPVQEPILEAFQYEEKQEEQESQESKERKKRK